MGAKIQVLLSTMHQNGTEVLKKMNIGHDSCVVVNQTDGDGVRDYNNGQVMWIDSSDRGLSKSRNLAISHASADICMLADDDMIYADNYQEIVQEAFRQHPEYDVITFQAEGIDKKFKDYYPQSRDITFFSVRSVASVEIAFRLDPIRKHNLHFNERFGAGCEFNHGEENLFLYDCLAKGLKILYIPKVIAKLYVGDSTWFKGYDQNYFRTNGAFFYNISKTFWWVFALRFAIFRYKRYAKECTLVNALKYMWQGKNMEVKIQKK